MMRPSAIFLSASLALALAACSSEKETEPTTSEADNFAARINGEQPTPPPPAVDPNAPPSVAQPQAAPAQGFAPGTASDPNSACNANLFAEFIGQQPNTDVRAKIMETASDMAEVRFVAPGSDYIKPDPTNPRLNVMIAVDGIIRDIRCG